MAHPILCFAGSSRNDSFNKKIARLMANEATELGTAATFIDLQDYELPLYNGDLEATAGLPEAAIRLQALFESHDGLLIASPEYNGFFSPLLKNTIDWLSRPDPARDDKPLPFANKVAGIVAASPGGFGGLRGLVPLRQQLAALGVTVVGRQLAIPSAHEKLTPDGQLSDAQVSQQLKEVVTAVINCQIKA